ncbi:CHAP domain-containing protein [Kitasatospora sp. NPDC059571]|uniref:CHAP domain-containing protein n=1 Tax=Kitasatospora sp. NPDC059571 TaxID=3346871 RepID=UPI00368F6F76
MSVRSRRIAAKSSATLFASVAMLGGLLAPAAHADTNTIVSIANANLGKKACSTNTTGGTGYYSSCTGANGAPEAWCADFAKWVWARSGYNVSGLTSGAGSFGQYGSRLHSTPQVGDALLFDYNGYNWASHVAIVTAVGNGTVTTVGGNEGGVSGNWSATSSVRQDTHSSAVGYRYGSETISGYVSPQGGSSTPPPSSPPQASAPSLGDAGSVVAEDGTQYTFTRDAANGHLQVTYLPKGGNWTTADMTAMAGTPVSAGGAPAAFIQHNGTIGVTTADAADGHLQITYLPKGGNWATSDLTDQVGTPVTGGGISNTVAPDGTLYIFSRGSTDGGHLSATYLNSDGAWATADMTGYVGTPASAGGAPAAFVQKDGTVGVVTANAANGHVYMTYLPSGGQWTGADMTTLAGTPVSDGNIGNAIAADGTHYIFSRGSTNGGHLSATYAGTTWTTTDMTNYVGTPASAGGAPAAFLQADGTVGVVTANAANGHVYMTYLPSGGQWTGADMTTLAGTPVTGGSIGNAIAPDGTHYIFTVGSTNGGHLSATYAGTTWTTTDMTNYIGTPAAG